MFRPASFFAGIAAVSLIATVSAVINKDGIRYMAFGTTAATSALLAGAAVADSSARRRVGR